MQKHPSLMSRTVIDALVDAGIVNRGERITRVVIDLQFDDFARIVVYRLADDKPGGLGDILPAVLAENGE